MMQRSSSLLVLLLLVFPLAAAAPSVAAAQGAWTAVDSVVAVVNQDVVLKSDLDRRMAAFKSSLDAVKDAAERSRRRIELGKQVLGSLIDERLLAQEAARVGIGAPDPEVDRAVADVKQQNKLDDAGLTKALADQGLTMAQYREELRGQIIGVKVANAILRPRVQIGEPELRAAYEEARKRDPKRIGTFDEVKEPLLQRLFEDAMLREQRRWLAERRADSYIDVRTKP
jgi:peptidyl-prolyl cis-trans isomerase SurA